MTDLEDDHNPKNKRTTWCGTLNGYVAPDLQASLLPLVKYAIVGEETAPETGQPHLQFYFTLSTPVRKSTLLNILRGTDWEHAALFATRKTPEHWREYCSKEGQFLEYGTIPSPGPKERLCWDEAFRAAEDGRFEDIPARIKIPYWRSLISIRDAKAPVLTHLEVPCGFWIHGQPGSGKSWTAHQLAHHLGLEVYAKLHNKWWDGYPTKSPCLVLLDDLHRDLVSVLVTMLKQASDVYPFRVESKGSSQLIRPTHVIVTSQWSPEQCLLDPADLQALQRRFRCTGVDKFLTVLTHGPQSRQHWVDTIPIEFWQEQDRWRNSTRPTLSTLPSARTTESLHARSATLPRAAVSSFTFSQETEYETTSISWPIFTATEIEAARLLDHPELRARNEPKYEEEGSRYERPYEW